MTRPVLRPSSFSVKQRLVRLVNRFSNGKPLLSDLCFLIIVAALLVVTVSFMMDNNNKKKNLELYPPQHVDGFGGGGGADSSSKSNHGFPSPLRTIRLRSGLEMPAIGYGTCCRPSAKGQQIYESAKLYLQHGGRLIDTAMAYRNHVDLGRAIRDSGLPRKELWITSKVAPNTVQSFDDTIHAVDGILQELGTDYLDLILIHSPKLGKEKTSELWRGLIQCKASRKARAIGVSNFNRFEIEEIAAANHGEMPEVNQIQLHPWSPPQWKSHVEWGKQHGVATTAYTSLGGSRFHRGGPEEWPSIVQQIAQRYGATPAQVLLQWSLRQGVAVIPGSGSEQHIVENLLIQDKKSTESSLDEMTDDEAAAIEAAPVPFGWFDSKRGPYKLDGQAAEVAWGGTR